MQFSLPIAMIETKEAIIKALNESRLPMCILDEMLNGIVFEVRQKAKEELQKEYDKQQKDTE